MYWPSLRHFGRKADVSVSGGEPEPFGLLRRELDRVFDSFGREMGFGFGSGRAGLPSIDVSETDKELTIEAELPGVAEPDVEVTVSDRLLTIRGEKKAEQEDKDKDYHLVERSYGTFSRTITLPFVVDPERSRAQFRHGVLTITLPKPPEVQGKARKIAIGRG